MNTLDSFTFLLCAQMLLNTYFTSRQSFVGQKKHFLYICQVSLAAIYTRTNFPFPKAGVTRLLGKEKL